jgi:predicted SprT family Zn-dependent metalloprotease
VRIPKSFNLLGKTITVEDDPRLIFTDGANGMAHYRTSRIRLQPHCHEQPVLAVDREHTFLHELVHHILVSMEQQKLNDDEKFVNLFSGLLHQAITTMEYDE